MSYNSQGKTIIQVFIIILLLTANSCILYDENTSKHSYNRFDITPLPTISPNPTNKLKEILSLNWGNKSNEVGNYCDEYAYLNKISYDLFISYGPRDFFVDKNDNIYVIDNLNDRLLKFKNRQLIKSCSYKKIAHINYPSIYTDSKENIYIAEVIQGEVKIVLKMEKDNNIVLRTPSDFPEPFIKCEIAVNQKSATCQEMQFKDKKMEITFPLKPIESYEFRFLGIDENYNFYFSKNIITTYKHSEEEKVKGIIIKLADCIIVNQGFILFKYNSKGDLVKEVKIDDPVPYNIKVNFKGNIYLSPILIGKALLKIPLDKYRIYKFNM